MNAQKVHTFATVVTSNDPMFNLTHNNVEHQLALVKKVFKKTNTKLLIPFIATFYPKIGCFCFAILLQEIVADKSSNEKIE